MRIGYLGPAGTYSEEALHELVAGRGDVEPEPFGSVPACFERVTSGDVAQVLVPIENSIEGPVNQTLDLLAAADGALVIVAEITHSIRHHLVAMEEVGLDRIERVISHPQATAQCARFLRSELPHAEVLAAPSTADAVRSLGESNGRTAAIGSLRAADLYGATVLASDIADVNSNTTRFALIGSEPAKAVGPGRFRTSIVCTIERDRPGALLAILQELAMRGVNMTRLESRPTKEGLGRYRFFIDIEGSRERDLAVAAAITAIEEQDVARVIFLGSFPMAA